MSQNGSERKTTIWRELAGQLSDHVDLAALELRYEGTQAMRRLAALGIMLILILTGFIVLQVAIIEGLGRFGLSMGWATLLLSGIYFLGAIIVYMVFCRRDPRLGPPFAASQREVHETLRWIQKLFS